MITEKDRSALRRVVDEAYNHGDYRVLRDVMDPDFIEHQFGLHETIEGMQEDIQILRKSFPDFNVTIEEMVSEGDKLWARLNARGTNLGGFMGPPNGKSFEITGFDVCRFKDGKIIEHWGSPDRFAMLAQLDLLPRKP